MKKHVLNGVFAIALITSVIHPLYAQNTASDNSAKTDDLTTVKLSPKIRSSAIETAIPEIPLSQINNFLLRNRIVELGTLDKSPHIIAGEESRVILSTGDTIYARGDFSKTETAYGIYRKGQEYIDPDTGEILGIQAIDIGGVQITASNGDNSTFVINRAKKEVRVGDRLLTSEQRQIKTIFSPQAPTNTVNGVIINVETGVSQAGKLDIIAINLGKKDNIEQGSMLSIFKKGERIKDKNAQRKTSSNVTLPDTKAGVVMVFQVFEKMSLAIILEAERGVAVEDFVRNP